MGWSHKWYEFYTNCLMCLCTLLPGGICFMQTCDAKLTSNKRRDPYIACLCSAFCGCIGLTFNRLQIKSHLGVGSHILSDVFLSWCCPCFSVTQEWMEVMKTKKGDPRVRCCNAFT